MRDLIKNTVELYYVEITGSTETTDTDGNYTGDFENTYSTPVKIRISLYPTSSDVSRELFGLDFNVDYVTNTSRYSLSINGLLYKSLPTKDFEKTFDYKVVAIKDSINTVKYGLVVR